MALFILIINCFGYNGIEVYSMQFLIIVGVIGLIVLLVMFLKKVFGLTVEDQEYSDKDDYLERRIKKDEEDK